MSSSTSLFNGKHMVAAIALTIVPLLPTLLLKPLGVQELSGPFLLATMAALMASVAAGVRLGLIVTFALAVAEMLVIPAAPYPVWAGLLMAVVAMVYGLSARRGMTLTIVTAPVAVAFTIVDPPRLDSGSVWVKMLAVGLFVVIGGLLGTAYGRFLGRKAPHSAPKTSSWRTGVVFGLAMAVVTGVTTAVIVASGIGHTGAWILLTIFLVVQPIAGQTLRRSLDRALGTGLGFGIALAVALLIRNETLLLVLGIVLITFAVYVKLDPRSKYWQFTMFLTPGIVLAEGAGADVVATDFDRLWASLAGVAIALALLVVFRVLGIRDKDEQSAEAANTQGSADEAPTAS